MCFYCIGNHVNVSVHWRDDGMLIMNWSLSEWLSLLGIVRVEWRLTTPFSSQWNVINNDGIINNYKVSGCGLLYCNIITFLLLGRH